MDRPTRRAFLAAATAAFCCPDLFGQMPEGSRQATGVKVGEVTDTTAIVWMRLTVQATHNAQGKRLPRGKAIRLADDVRLEDLRGACPGAPGRVRLRYGTAEDLGNAQATAWSGVDAKTDFTHQFRLAGLQPGTGYHYSAETTGPGGKPEHAPLRGRFATAPAADRYADVTFTVVTGTMYKDLDHDDGFHIFPAMGRLRPNFYIHTGDNVYYDSDDFVANTVARARHHWHRLHALPRVVAFHQQVSGYWEKDDHDTLCDDCWPTMNPQRMLPLTFPEGLAVFREQVPMGALTYRTIRWGRGLQIWLTEGRDYRSPNTAADGPDKTIWGQEQKDWLMKTLLASTADYKVLISPTPIVGPDRANKRDNHANAAFRHEGDEFRRWARKNLGRNFVLACGDRHWQYHSVHPETGLHEFSCGPGSDIHAGGSPGLDKEYHRFHRVGGGFLAVNFRAAPKPRLVMHYHDVQGETVYEYVV